jgi:hypothetical protein
MKVIYKKLISKKNTLKLSIITDTLKIRALQIARLLFLISSEIIRFDN